MTDTTTFIRNPDCWKDGIVPDELRDPESWRDELNCGSNIDVN
jgi:hypothetical protein